MAPDSGSMPWMGHCSMWAVGAEGKSLPRKPSPQDHPPLAFICSFINTQDLLRACYILGIVLGAWLGVRGRENSELNRK